MNKSVNNRLDSFRPEYRPNTLKHRLLTRLFGLLLLASFGLVLSLLSSCVVHTAPTAAEVRLAKQFGNHTAHPPFSRHKRFMISQSFNGRRSHTGEFNAFAVDFVMPIGEPVCAAKAGVVESYNDVDRPMLENKNFREDNYVRILHLDGTWGLYAHLLPGSISVKPKQKIARGECFAKVGNTGLSTGPHLHFALLKLLPDRFISVPFRFVQPDGQVIKPRFLGWIKN